DLTAAHRGGGQDARPDRGPVEVHGARSALGHAAAELGSGHAEQIAQHPEERHLLLRVDLAHSAVDVELHAPSRLPRRHFTPAVRTSSGYREIPALLLRRLLLHPIA